MQKLSMGLLCPLLFLFLGSKTYAQTWKQAYAVTSQMPLKFTGITAKDNTFIGYAMDDLRSTVTIIRSSDGGRNFSLQNRYAEGNFMGYPADSVFITTVPAIVDENTYFAGTKNGIYKTTNKGLIYTPVYRKPGVQVSRIVFMGSTGLAIVHNTNLTLSLLRSTDAEKNMEPGKS